MISSKGTPHMLISTPLTRAVLASAVGLSWLLLACGGDDGGVGKSSLVIDKPWVFLSAAGESTRLTAQVLDAEGAPSAGPVVMVD